MTEEELHALRQKVEEAHENSLRWEKEARLHGSAVMSFWQGKSNAYDDVLIWLDEIEDDTRR